MVRECHLSNLYLWTHRTTKLLLIATIGIINLEWTHIHFCATLTLSQCTLAGPVYTGMPLECHWLTQCTLGYHWATQRILAGYTGTPLEKLSWNSPTLECHWINLVESAPHWDVTGELLHPTLEHHWRDCDSPHTPRHIKLSMQSSIHASLKWQDGGTPVSKWTGLCIFNLYLEFTTLRWIPVLLLTHVITSTSCSACLWYEHR